MLHRLRCQVLAGLAVALLWPAAAQALSGRGPLQETFKPLADPEPQFPVDAQWTLVEMNGKPAPADPPSFRLDQQYRASGFSGCNTYSMTLYPAHHQRLLAGPIALTRKSCDKAAMLAERQFLVGLHSGPTWSVQNGELLIKSPNASMRLRRGI